MGHIKKANTEPKRFLREIRGVNASEYTVGQVLAADTFEAGEVVDVTGTSKGKGFQGVIKRHNQSRGPMGHGSHYHRGPGSMGTMRPMRVLKGKKLPGHMGNELTTIQNLEIISLDIENNVILISGNIPGPKQGLIMIRTAIKNEGKNTPVELLSYIVSEVEEVALENEAETLTDEVIEESVLNEETVEETVEETKEEATEETVENKKED